MKEISEYKKMLDFIENGKVARNYIFRGNVIKKRGIYSDTFGLFEPVDVPWAQGAEELLLWEPYIADFFEETGALATIAMEGVTVMASRDGMTFYFDGNVKSVKYVYDDEYAWRFQKTQFKSSNPYSVFKSLCSDFWRKVVMNGMKDAGYIPEVPESVYEPMAA